MSPLVVSPSKPVGSRRVLAVLLCAALAAGAARAQEVRAEPAGPAGEAAPEDDATTYTLGEIEIFVHRDRGVRATETVTRVTAEEIARSGASTLDQALALLPAVNVRAGAEGVPRVDVRGLRTRHVLLLLDGVPLSSAVDGQFDPRLIPTEDVAAVEVVAGPASVLYGPGGLGAVVNVITRKGAGRLRGSVAAQAGDHQPYLLRASASGAVGPLDYLLGGSAARVDAAPLSGRFRPTSEQPAGYRSNSDHRREGLLANLGWAPRDDLGLGLTMGYAHAAYGKPSSVLGADVDPYAAAPRYDRVPDSEVISIQAAGDHRPAPWLRVRGWAFANRLEEQDDRYDDASYRSFDRMSGSYRQHVRSTVLGAALRPRIELGGAGAIGFLFSAERDTWENRGRLTVGRDAYASADLDRWLGRTSAAVELELSPVRGLGLVVGYGRHWQAQPGGGVARGDSALAAASLRASAVARLRLSCGKNVRFPSLGDLYAPGKGSPSLGPERALTCAAGADLRLADGGAVLGAGAFATRARGLIQTDQATGQAANLAEVRFAGFELSAAARPVRPLVLRAGYAFLHSQDRSRAGREEQQYTPRHRASAEGSWELPFGLAPYLSGSYVGGQFYYPRGGATGGKRKLADRLVLDARLRQRLLDGRLDLTVGATNLLDQDYETSYGFPAAGRLVYGGVELRL